MILLLIHKLRFSSQKTMYCAPFAAICPVTFKACSTRPTGISFRYPVSKDCNILIDGMGMLILAFVDQIFHVPHVHRTPENIYT